jgi:uncharacterized protein (UPF0548 family)
MFLLRRPAAVRLDRLLAHAGHLPLSYDPPGIARTAAPAGYRVVEAEGVIGQGRDAFQHAVIALTEWRQFNLGWVAVYPRRAPLRPGTTVLVLARHLGFWSVNACRVLYLLGDCPRPRGLSPQNGDTLRVAGFAYGSLTMHAETGEEIFEVSYDPASGAVRYRIRAVSRERAALARLGFPVARALQHRFRVDSIAAMRRAVAEPAP